MEVVRVGVGGGDRRRLVDSVPFACARNGFCGGPPRGGSNSGGNDGGGGSVDSDDSAITAVDIIFVGGVMLSDDQVR